MTPLKSPTAVLIGTCNSCAGRNSIRRYIQAVGLPYTEYPTPTPVTVQFSPFDKKPLISHTMVKIPIRIPGRGEPSYIDVAVFDQDRVKDFPIELNKLKFLLIDGVESGSPFFGYTGKEGAMLFPFLDIPRCGAAYEFYPFPSDNYDEDQTQVYANSVSDLTSFHSPDLLKPLPSMQTLKYALKSGIVKVAFKKVSNGKNQMRTLFGTTCEIFIPKSKREGSETGDIISDGRVELLDFLYSSDDETVTAPEAGISKSNVAKRVRKQCREGQIIMFDMDLYEWRSCKFENIVEVKIKESVYGLRLSQ